MEGIIFLIIVAAIFSAGKKKLSEFIKQFELDEEKKVIITQRRENIPQGGAPQNPKAYGYPQYGNTRSAAQQAVSQEGPGDYTPVKPTVKPQVHDAASNVPKQAASQEGPGDYAPATPMVKPQVHTQGSSDANCESHKKPISSEGSDIRAHVSVDTHDELQADKRNGAKAKPHVPKPEAYAIRNSKQAKGSLSLSFDSDAMLSGIIYSEILAPPKARQRR